MVIDPDTKDMALFIFNTYDRLGNVQSTHKAFVERYGNIKGINSIRNTLRNEKYIGINGENTAFCVPLVDTDLFGRVQKRLAQNVKKAPTREIYLFSRLIACPKCGAILYAYRGETTKAVHHYYRCPNNQYAKGYACDFTTVREDRVETEMLDKVGILANETKYRFKRATSDDSGKKIETIRKKLDRLKELYIDGDIDKATYLRRKSAFESELREHEELHQPTVKASVDEILTLNVREIYEALTAENKRAFWHHFIERIHVDETGHVVHIDFL